MLQDVRSPEKGCGQKNRIDFLIWLKLRFIAHVGVGRFWTLKLSVCSRVWGQPVIIPISSPSMFEKIARRLFEVSRGPELLYRNTNFFMLVNIWLRTTGVRHWFSSQALQLESSDNDGYTRRLSDAWDEAELRTLPASLRPRKGETLDLILRQKVYLLQSRRGYRANVDSHILAYFASDISTRNAIRVAPEKLNVLDLGAGNGLVSILFAKSQQPCNVHLVELQPQLVDRARRNLWLNDIAGEVIQHDLKDGHLPEDLRGCFDVVLINPPFYPAGSRKPPRRREKLLAHMETSATISDFLHAARTALSTDNRDAFVAMIHDIQELRRLGLAFENSEMLPASSREMRHTSENEATRILVQLKPRTISGSTSRNDTAENGNVHGRDVLKDVRIPSQPPIVLFPNSTSQNRYSDYIEAFLEKLPLPSVRIGRLRDVK